MRGVNIMFSRQWLGKTARFQQLLLCALMTFVMCSGLAWGADKNNKLTAITVDSGAAAPTVLIETAEPVGYRYTVYDSFEPTRVVIDFPGMDVAGVAQSIAGNQGVVKDVRVSDFALASGQLARVEILLAENAEYQVNLDGNKFRITFADAGKTAKASTSVQMPVPAPAPVAKVESAPAKTAPESAAASSKDALVLRDVKLSAGRALLDSTGKIDKLQYFTLGNPPRLVVDLYGVKPGFKQRSFAAEAGFKTVRVGINQDKTRLVFDASDKILPKYQVEERPSDILVTWAAAEPEPAAQAPAPVEAAKPVVSEAPARKTPPVNIEAIDFNNEEGRSMISVALSSKAEVTGPVAEGKLVRFEIVNAKISRSLRRTIDASAFPSAVSSVTPYTVTDGDHQNVRIAVDIKGPVAYSLEQDDAGVRLVVDDGAYAEPVPPAVSKVEVVAPEVPADRTDTGRGRARVSMKAPMTAAEMTAEAQRYTGEKITLVFDSANVRSILQLIGDVSGLNILASSDVQGTVTLRLIDVPWDQALDLVLETASLGKVQEGNVLRILPKDKIRELEQADMKQQQVAIDEGILETRTFAISHASVDDMKGFLTDIKSERGSIIADSRNKQLIVRDVATVLEQMQEMIIKIDKPDRQVMIEARIVEANTNFSRNLGVKWNFDYQDNNSPSDGLNSIKTGLGGSFLVPVTNPAAAGLGTSIAIGALDDQLNIDLRISALETSGEGKIVSTPRITTLNGEKATISQGTKIPYASVSDAGTDVKFENAELKLDVTPEINPDGSILLQINASNSAVGQVVPTSTGGEALSIEEKKAETKVLVRDGQTTVIGGIFIEDERDSETGVPLLMSIPIFGNLFKSTSKARERRELLIFITPRIVGS
jgi:type IV pilus assembly protein PilQ